MLDSTAAHDDTGPCETIAPPEPPLRRLEARVTAECDRLTDVVLCPPSSLSPVPCCAVTRDSLRKGHRTRKGRALEQHSGLVRTLNRLGVTCHPLPAAAAMPDMCFTRDVAVVTPWDVTLLRPAKSHRAAEVRHMQLYIEAAIEGRVRALSTGRIEGGDVCIAREGLLIIGISGERTTLEGARAFAAPFAAAGWDVLYCPLDSHFLHLDTVFCMASGDRALAHVEALDPQFLRAVRSRGIELLPVTYEEVARLGCNILSIDGAHLVAAAGALRVARMLEATGFLVHVVDVSEMTACGGGIHCLTMPIRRSAEDVGRQVRPVSARRSQQPASPSDSAGAIEQGRNIPCWEA